MPCPNCGAPWVADHAFCSACGARLHPVKKGSHLPPLLIMAGLSALGILLYFLLPM